MNAKRMAVIKVGRKYRRAILIESRDGRAEWARHEGSNIILFPGAFEEEESYELPDNIADIDQLAIALNEGKA